MEAAAIRETVNEVVANLIEDDVQQVLSIPVGVSARHVHLSPEHVESLFGEGYELTVQKPLSQPGQFAANETVVVVGPRGALERVRILGPARGQTQIEVAFTDALRLGVVPPVRDSGNIDGSAPATLVGPKGAVHVKEGMIMAKRHVHMHPEDAKRFGVQNGETIRLQTVGERAVMFDQVLVRVSDKY